MEKAVITSEMISAGGDDLDEVRQAFEGGIWGGGGGLGLGFRV